MPASRRECANTKAPIVRALASCPEYDFGGQRYPAGSNRLTTAMNKVSQYLPRLKPAPKKEGAYIVIIDLQSRRHLRLGKPLLLPEIAAIIVKCCPILWMRLSMGKVMGGKLGRDQQWGFG